MKGAIIRIGLFIGLWGFLVLGLAAENRHLLQNELRRINLAQSMVVNFQELDFPTYADRDFWDNTPAEIRKSYIRNAEAALNYSWPSIKATDYLAFVQSGDRRDSVFWAPRTILTSLVMGELIEGEGRFLDQIVNGIWFYCEQTWWGWSAHLYLQKAPPGLPDIYGPVIDLGVADVANLLSWTYFFLEEQLDNIHPLISARLKDEIRKKVLIPYYERHDFWWQGFDRSRPLNNWNPWINYNLLSVILLMEDNREKKIAGVEKVIESLDYFLTDYAFDGGCDEGPSYWGHAGASLFQCLEFVKMVTKGKFNVFHDTQIKNIGSYIYKVYINYPYFVNFSDADAIVTTRSDIIYAYGNETGDSLMREFGAYLAQRQNWGKELFSGTVDEQIVQLMKLDEIRNFQANNVLIRDFWFPGIEVGGGRDAPNSPEGFFFAAKGGNNAESHNHNDVGSCVMYYNGKPCIIDIGREKYTSKTFSSNRYDIWTFQSQFHNLPTINGFNQSHGHEYKAKNTFYEADEKQMIFSTDIASVYPKEAGIEKWERTYQLQRGKRFTIKDSYELSEIKDTTSINLILYCKVQPVKSGIIHLTGYHDEYHLVMKYNSALFIPKIEFYPVADSKLNYYWPEGITRIVLKEHSLSKKGKSDICITAIEKR
ncbi:MAG: heparinase II/III family protein [Massilibacteroides sp.]|nr:heparinase II/III family protein [Massilibacteroides sp.]